MTIGPLPILWDRWTISAPWRPRLLLHELLAASAEQTELVLDLKGRRFRLAGLVLESLQPYLGSRRFTVCARDWRLLEPFADVPVRSVHSVGSMRQLRRFLRQRHLADDGDHFRERNQPQPQPPLPLPLVGIVLLEVQDHHDEQVQHQDGAGVHDQLDRRQELGVQGDEQARDVEEHHEERDDAVHGVAQGNHEDGGQDDDTPEVEEGQGGHDRVGSL